MRISMTSRCESSEHTASFDFSLPPPPARPFLARALSLSHAPTAQPQVRARGAVHALDEAEARLEQELSLRRFAHDGTRLRKRA